MLCLDQVLILYTWFFIPQKLTANLKKNQLKLISNKSSTGFCSILLLISRQKLRPSSDLSLGDYLVNSEKWESLFTCRPLGFAASCCDLANIRMNIISSYKKILATSLLFLWSNFNIFCGYFLQFLVSKLPAVGRFSCLSWWKEN